MTCATCRDTGYTSWTEPTDYDGGQTRTVKTARCRDCRSGCCLAPLRHCWLCDYKLECSACGACSRCGAPIDEAAVIREHERQGVRRRG